MVEFSRQQVAQAGARYTPGIDPDAPNIDISDLTKHLIYAVGGFEVQRAHEEFAQRIEKQWKIVCRTFEDAEQLESKISTLAAGLRTLRMDALRGQRQSVTSLAAFISDITLSAETVLNRLRDEERLIQQNQRIGNDSAADHARPFVPSTLRREVEEFVGILNALNSDLRGPLGTLLTHPLCLIVGQWGTGKTHLLCDYTLQVSSKGQMVLLVLAKSIQTQGDVARTLAKVSIGASTARVLIERLNELGRSSGTRSLLVIDGINEGPRLAWRSAIDELVKLAESRTHVALCLSCRSPFEVDCIRDTTLSRFTQVVHRGFDEREFDAQAEFFRHYKLPLPEVPLLDEEFSRPLTLKLICESFRELKTEKQKKGFFGIASGQKGMTFVLESFVKRVAAPLEVRYGLPPVSL